MSPVSVVDKSEIADAFPADIKNPLTANKEIKQRTCFLKFMLILLNINIGSLINVNECIKVH